MPRAALKIVFAVAATLALGYTPLKSAGLLRPTASCELSAPLELWWSGLQNSRHVISYGVLCLLAVACFAKQRVAKAAATVLVISALVELEQAFLAEGHCRIRDMLPNLLAVCLASLLWLAFSRRLLRRPRASRPPPL